MAWVPVEFPSRVQADIDEVQRRLLAPIFNDDAELQATFLTFVARGLAGLVADKAWGAGLGERNSGKSVLLTLSMAETTRSLRGETLLNKRVSPRMPCSWLSLVFSALFPLREIYPIGCGTDS